MSGLKKEILMPQNNKPRSEEKSTHGLTAEELTNTTRKTMSRLSPELQGYIALAIGLFLLLFSLGYFAFVKLAIGFIGLALITWGVYASHLITTIRRWFTTITKLLAQTIKDYTVLRVIILFRVLRIAAHCSQIILYRRAPRCR